MLQFMFRAALCEIALIVATASSEFSKLHSCGGFRLNVFISCGRLSPWRCQYAEIVNCIAELLWD